MIWNGKDTEQWMMEYWVGYEKNINIFQAHITNVECRVNLSIEKFYCFFDEKKNKTNYNGQQSLEVRFSFCVDNNS